MEQHEKSGKDSFEDSGGLNSDGGWSDDVLDDIYRREKAREWWTG